MLREYFQRVSGYILLSARRLYIRGTRTATRRTAATIVGVAVAIALLVIASGLAVGLATQTTVYGENVDYWIVPEGGGETSALVSVDGPQFGDAHATTAQIESLDGVRYATPVSTTVRYVEGPTDGANVLFIGVIPRDNMGTVTGVSTEGLTVRPVTDNPDRTWQGEVVLSQSAATQLGLTNATAVSTIRTDGATFDVSQIDDENVAADLPIALVQLTDLQQLTGGDKYDTADQYLVSTTDPDVRSELETIYPKSSVNTRSDLTTAQIAETDAALAISIGAFIITFVVGTLFVVMTAGLELTTDATTIATLSAIGVSRRSQMILTGVQTLLLTILGGILGVILGMGSLYTINSVVSRVILSIPIASTHPGLAVYGLFASVIIGIVTLPYVRYLLGRIGTEEVMR